MLQDKCKENVRHKLVGLCYALYVRICTVFSIYKGETYEKEH